MMNDKKGIPFNFFYYPAFIPAINICKMNIAACEKCLYCLCPAFFSNSKSDPWEYPVNKCKK